MNVSMPYFNFLDILWFKTMRDIDSKPCALWRSVFWNALDFHNWLNEAFSLRYDVQEIFRVRMYMSQNKRMQFLQDVKFKFWSWKMEHSTIPTYPYCNETFETFPKGGRVRIEFLFNIACRFQGPWNWKCQQENMATVKSFHLTDK